MDVNGDLVVEREIPAGQVPDGWMTQPKQREKTGLGKHNIEKAGEEKGEEAYV